MKIPSYMIILIAIAAGAIGSYILFGGGVEVESYEEEMKQAQEQAAYWKAKFENKEIDYRKVDSILSQKQEQVIRLNDSINKLIQQADEDIDNVDTFTPSELQEFFTNRYPTIR